MSRQAEVVSVNLSTQKGTTKQPQEHIQIEEQGVVADPHAGPWHRQVSRFGIGSVELEISQIGKTCHGASCSIFREVGKCIMPKEGLFSRVVTGGAVKPGDHVAFLPKDFICKVVTLSDRASRGDYTDKSGPLIQDKLDHLIKEKGWRGESEVILIPDEASTLRDLLRTFVDNRVDLVFTTGGTGIGSRDVTPEVVSEICDKLIPGIVEAIRFKFGSEKPQALLSRSVAGVAGQTLIFALPGSTRAVDEYLGEIFKSLEHLIYMLHDLDVH